MKKAKHTADELRAEYKLSDFKARGVRGKHVKRYRAGTNLVLLAPDVARAFPTDKAVNDALTGLIRTGKQPASRSTANGRKR
ncbi:MAG: hypothetical protein HYS46_02285 [Betaproteobacteria bacterium]|nr:hypothetical protein [Betaproteobacteria bacterium]